MCNKGVKLRFNLLQIKGVEIMKLGYARVSTTEQNLDRQLKALEDYGIEKLFTEKCSGKTIENRNVLKELLDYSRSDDEIVILSLDRLSRNYNDVKEILSLIQQKGIKLTVLDAPFLNFDTGNETLDMAMYDIVISLLSYIADNERKQILERQKQGIELAKLNNVYKGKPLEYSSNSKSPAKRAIYNSIKQELETETTITAIAKKYGVSRYVVRRIRDE